MPENNFLFNMPNSNSLVNSNSTNYPYSSTLPPTQCSNGTPIPKYLGYGVFAWEVLYSIWVANQSTIGAQFTLNQATYKEPTTEPYVGPANIFIMRHGEKASSPTPNWDLNGNGVYRACRLIEYVNQLALEGTPISYIITINPCPYNSSDPSMRPMQTVSMASFMLNIPIYVAGNQEDFNQCIQLLFDTNTFSGLNVIICWEHSCIQPLTLSILNAAGQNGRLPNDVSPTEGITDLWGDAYFKKYSPKNNICPDGNYLSPKEYYNSDGTKTNSLYYVDLNPDSAKKAPSYIGPNSQFYPYWNNYNFDTVYCLKSSIDTDFKFNFTIIREPILTCYSSCDLHIGLYQPLNEICVSSNKYYNESKCQTPSINPNDWQVYS